MTPETETRTIVGLDLHSAKVALYISKWKGNIELVRESKSTVTDLDSLKDTYLHMVPKDSLTVIEATTNAFTIARLLLDIGYDACVVTSDTLQCLERRDHINDKLDARNLTRMEAAGLATKVFVPSREYQAYRSLLNLYQSTVTEITRYSNRLWEMCCSLNLKHPPRGSAPKTKQIESYITDPSIPEISRFCFDHLLSSYK